MKLLLGLDEDILQKVSDAEKSLYRGVSITFLVVAFLSLLSNGYFGYLMTGEWWGVVLLGLLMGFIHFSVMRISLITLMTKPLVEKKSTQPIAESAPIAKDATVPPASSQVDSTSLSTPASGLRKFLPSFGSVRQKLNTAKSKNSFSIVREFNLSTVIRIVFTGLIAITICMPLTTVFFHAEAMKIQDDYRRSLATSYESNIEGIQVNAGPLGNDLKQAHYPFVIMEKLWMTSSFRFLFFIFMLLVYTPSIVLARLRYRKEYKYADLCRDAMRKEIVIDYQETVEQSQYFLNRQFPEFKKKLSDLTAFSDPPFKQQPRNVSSRIFGSKAEFNKYMRSL